MIGSPATACTEMGRQKRMKELIFLKPVFKSVIWGGNQLHTKFGYDIPSDTTGEAWVVSAHPKGDCEVVGGEYQGMTLSELWNTHRELFGGQEGDRFPLLVKIIDAREDLSIQVHPDDAYARVNENGSLGKTECWYVLACDPDAHIVVGHYATSKDEMIQMISEDRWDDFLRVIPIHKGDFFQIEPGTVHAIKGGTMILETQQSSDVTYRLYDYDRLQDGKLRPLHLEKSMDVIKCPYIEHKEDRCQVKTDEYCLEQLVQCEFYTVEHLQLYGTIRREEKTFYEIVDVIEGSGLINGRYIHKGDHFIIPNGFGNYEITGEMEIMFSYDESR